MLLRPLVVDLDGTLFLGDSAWENFRVLLLRKPLKIPEMLAQSLQGRAALKCWLHATVGHEGEPPVMRAEVVEAVRAAKSKRIAIHLVSGAPQILVDDTARRLDLDLQAGHWGSQPGANLTYVKKLFLVKRFGDGGYDYFGDSNVDLPVFSHCDRGAVVAARPGTVHRALQANPKLRVVSPLPSFGASALKGLRAHQWIKNLLLLVPLFSAHEWDQVGKWFAVLVGVTAFSFLSSAVYLLNDFHDLEADRKHPHKKSRPLASGELKIPEALAFSALLMGVALGLAWALGFSFFGYVAIYLVMTSLYSNWAKHKAGLDLIALAAFYTLRILAGGAATRIVCSPWLLGYAIFLFLSLACVKRASELHRLKGEKKLWAEGRGYGVGDLEALSAIGISSGVVSVLVAALYVNSPDVRVLYAQPEFLWLLCPIFFYWVIRVWLKTLRGEMPEDPVLFALKDRGSWILLVLAVAIGLAASR